MERLQHALRALHVSSASALLLLPSVASAQIVINEVRYDSAGASDGSEFVEIQGPPGTSLEGFLLVGIDGDTGTPYRTVELLGHAIPDDAYFVVTNDAFLPGADLVVPGTWENGPDEIELVQGPFTVDALCYGSAAALSCEGDPAPLAPEGSSLARCPDGADSNVNADDFAVVAGPTPGATNEDTCEGPTTYTLCELRETGPDGRPTREGERVRVTGLVAYNGTGVFRAPGEGLEVAVTEVSPERPARGGARCCILLLDPTFDDLATPITEGDGLTEIVGRVGFVAGVTVITNVETLTVGGSGLAPSPIDVTTGELAANGEAYESCFVDACGVMITGGEPWPPAGTNADLVIDDTSGPVGLRVDGDTDVAGSSAPLPPFSVMGIVGESETLGYHLRPRRRDDVIDDMMCPVPIAHTSWGRLKTRFR